MAAEEQGPRYPLWAYGAVGVALVLAALWLIAAVIGFVLGLIKLAVVVVLAVALVAWIVGHKADRRR